MKNKIKLGIDIDEILRAKWLQFDRYYAMEYGDEGVPDEPYCFDYFSEYTWEDSLENEKVLIEDDDVLNAITPLDYTPDENGVVAADLVLFDTKENKITAIEKFNRFMFIDFCFEIFGTAPIMYKGLDTDFNSFHKKFEDFVEIYIISKENKQSIPPTLFFLSKMGCRVNNIKFYNNSADKINDVDILITTDPEILSIKHKGKKIIKLSRPYNMELKNFDLEAMQLFDLYDNDEFIKMIKYK